MTALASAPTRPRSLLRMADLGAGELTQLLNLAAELKAEPHQWRWLQRGRLLGCWFSKPSTRTRVSLEAAAYRLGMLPVMLRPDELQLGRGEPVADTARVLSSYCDALAIRTFSQQEVEELASNATVPVINALTDLHHPCQALADLLTLREQRGRLAGLRLAYVGDGNNVAHSLIEAGALCGMTVAVATPAGYEPDAAIVASAREVAERSGGAIELWHEAAAAAEGADAVYTDVWVSMGQDAEQADRRVRLRAFQVTPALMERAAADAVFMHCLPAHRGEEVLAEVIDGPRSVVFEQAANRLPTEQALIHALISGSWKAP